MSSTVSSDQLTPFLRQLPRPEPSAGVEAYLKERERALAFCEKKRKNYEIYQQSSRKSAIVDYLPIKLDIENVSRCNFACTMCIVSTWKRGKRAEDMTVEKFKQIIDEQYGLVEIKLNGLGEALLQGDDFFEMISYARSKHIWVRITTNASLLHARENYKKLIDSGVNEIDISIDGADKTTFESIRRQSNFERVVQNCKLLNDYTKRLGIKRTKMWTLVQENNYQQLTQLVELSAEMGFSYYVLSLTLHGWGHEDLAERNRSVTVEHKLTPDYLQSLIELGQSLGIKVCFWSVNDKFDTSSPDKLCSWPFERAVITSDLRTVPCCMIGDPDAFEIGGGSGKSFLELWKGEQYKKFREAHLKGRIPEICKGCYKHNS
ncbi:MAG: putative mycofactocin radical SAM maturase MftC [Chlamydiae bacterium]|nr:putative mycofactocin radical SAM maturase MftC [Chlamydiota bacterium]